MESPHFKRLYLTRIKKKFECDTFFPSIPNDFVLTKYVLRFLYVKFNILHL